MLERRSAHGVGIHRVAAGASMVLFAGFALASSHREAPFVTEHPKVDGTDFYMFRSYEPGREEFVTIVANYQPLQAPYGGPNYFTMDPGAVYEIHIDNNGDAVEDLTFQFQFNNTLRNIELEVGDPGQTKKVGVPVVAVGPISAENIDALNVLESYTATLIRGPRRHGSSAPLINADTNESVFAKPADNIGNKTIPDYEAYAAAHVYNVVIPGCNTQGRMFVGQRKDPFVVNLGETFDLVNITNPLGPVDAEADDLADANVTSFILELPIACVTANNDPVIAAWTSASLPKRSRLDPTPSFERPAREWGTLIQVSRLAMPLVNEVVIGISDKDRFNASEPKNDGQFANYVTHPTLPEILEILFFDAGVRAPNLFPRADLVAAFLTGIDGLNKTDAVAEMMRLNTSISPAPAEQQNNLGVIAGDLAGFPNGRRPGDDVVDIALRVVMGKLLSPEVAPSGQLPFTDGAIVNGQMFLDQFPYLSTPLPGSPNGTP